MPIDLKCYATLAPLTPDNASAFPLKDGETIRALAERLTIPIGNQKIVFVNGQAAGVGPGVGRRRPDRPFPPVGGS